MADVGHLPCRLEEVGLLLLRRGGTARELVRVVAETVGNVGGRRVVTAAKKPLRA